MLGLCSYCRTILLLAFLVLGACAPTEDSDGFQLPDDPRHEWDQGPDEGVVPRSTRKPWRNPDYTEAEARRILKDYSHIDRKKRIPVRLLRQALLFYHRNQRLLENDKAMAVVNFGTHSKNRRFFVINMKTGRVEAFHVAHGKGSDRSHSGIATKFSDVPNSEMTSLGYYVTAESYHGQHGLSLRLDGLSKSNVNARARAIVIHGAAYVADKNVKQGRSWGCLVFSQKSKNKILSRLKSGALIYAARNSSDPAVLIEDERLADVDFSL